MNISFSPSWTDRISTGYGTGVMYTRSRNQMRSNIATFSSSNESFPQGSFIGRECFSVKKTGSENDILTSILRTIVIFEMGVEIRVFGRSERLDPWD